MKSFASIVDRGFGGELRRAFQFLSFIGSRSMTWTAIALIACYRWVLSPAKSLVFGSCAECRFEPSCSIYAISAYSNHGFLKGSRLTANRLCRCHPWGKGGHDPVPKSIACAPASSSLLATTL